MTGKAEQKSFETPDETRTFDHGAMHLLRIGGGDVGRLTLQPGWRWSQDVKPLAGTELCEAPHFQYHVHGLLVALFGTARHSVVVNMFGYDEDELNTIIQGKLADERVYVQMSLDRSQASGVHEKAILAKWNNDAFGNSIAIGTSSVHNAISHLKIVIVDGVYTVKGSTNWSLSGEQQQDNELSLNRNAVIAAETRAILDLNHDFMLKQMVGSGLNVAKFLAPTAPGASPPLPPAPDSVGAAG